MSGADWVVEAGASEGYMGGKWLAVALRATPEQEYTTHRERQAHGRRDAGDHPADCSQAYCRE